MRAFPSGEGKTSQTQTQGGSTRARSEPRSIRKRTRRKFTNQPRRRRERDGSKKGTEGWTKTRRNLPTGGGGGRAKEAASCSLRRPENRRPQSGANPRPQQNVPRRPQRRPTHGRPLNLRSPRGAPRRAWWGAAWARGTLAPPEREASREKSPLAPLERMGPPGGGVFPRPRRAGKKQVMRPPGSEGAQVGRVRGGPPGAGARGWLMRTRNAARSTGGKMGGFPREQGGSLWAVMAGRLLGRGGARWRRRA